MKCVSYTLHQSKWKVRDPDSGYPHIACRVLSSSYTLRNLSQTIFKETKSLERHAL